MVKTRKTTSTTVRTAIGTKKTVAVDRNKNIVEIAGIITDGGQLLRAYSAGEHARAKRQHKALVKRVSKVRLY